MNYRLLYKKSKRLICSLQFKTTSIRIIFNPIIEVGKENNDKI